MRKTVLRIKIITLISNKTVFPRIVDNYNSPRQREIEVKVENSKIKRKHSFFTIESNNPREKIIETKLKQ